MKENDIIFETSGNYVTRERLGYVVWRHNDWHTLSDSTYELTPDGLSIAKARCDYLAKKNTSVK